MKTFIYALLAIIAIMLILLLFPRSCDKKIDNLEHKKDKSLIIDSIITEQTRQSNIKQDLLVAKYEDSITKIHAKTAVIAKNYNALRAIVKGMKLVKIDSVGQKVGNIPADQYNASIEQGNVCDEYLNQKNAELNVKDSIISSREIQIGNNNKEIEAKEQAIQDLIALDEQKGKKLKHAKSLNKKIPLLLAIDAVIVFVVTAILLK